MFVCMSVRESERDIASVLVPASVSETVCVCVSVKKASVYERAMTKHPHCIWTNVCVLMQCSFEMDSA